MVVVEKQASLQAPRQIIMDVLLSVSRAEPGVGPIGVAHCQSSFSHHFNITSSAVFLPHSHPTPFLNCLGRGSSDTTLLRLSDCTTSPLHPPLPVRTPYR